MPTNLSLGLCTQQSKETCVMKTWQVKYEDGVAFRFAPEPSPTKDNLNDYPVRFQTNFCSIITPIGLSKL